MLINKYCDGCNRGSIFFAAIICIVLPFFSSSVFAIIVEGSVTGVIRSVDTYVDDGELNNAFFEAAVEGRPFSANFWYEFDESKFPPGEFFRQYDFDFSSIGIVAQVGDQSFSSIDPNGAPLIHLWNAITIGRYKDFSYFDLTTSSIYSGIKPSGDTRTVSLTFDSVAVEHFSGFDLAQNISLTSSDGNFLGELEVMHYGSRVGDKYPGDTDDYTYIFWGGINSIHMHVRSSTVDEPGSSALIMLVLLSLGWRYCRK